MERKWKTKSCGNIQCESYGNVALKEGGSGCRDLFSYFITDHQIVVENLADADHPASRASRVRKIQRPARWQLLISSNLPDLFIGHLRMCSVVLFWAVFHLPRVCKACRLLLSIAWLYSPQFTCTSEPSAHPRGHQHPHALSLAADSKIIWLTVAACFSREISR